MKRVRHSLLAAAVFLMWSANVWAGELTGAATANYRWQEDEGETSYSMEQRLRLNWGTALSNVDLLDLYFQISREDQSDPEEVQTRPIVGFNLSGPEYRLLLEYREFEEDNQEVGGFTKTTETLFTTFNYSPEPEYPDLSLDFSRTKSYDDLDEPQTDFVETDWGVRTNYDNGPLSIRYSHRENEFENNLEFLTSTDLQFPVGVAIDLSGIIYVTDAGEDRVFRFSPSGGFLGEFGGFGSGEGFFNNPTAIDTDGSFIYVVDSDNDRVQRFDMTGRFVSEFGSFGIGNGEFDNPYGIAVDATGIYVTDQDNDRVQKFTIDGTFLFTFSGTFSAPSGIVSNGSQVFVADTQNHRIQVFTTDGAFVTQFGSFGSGIGQFQFPSDVAIDSLNRIYVTDTGNDRVEVFTAGGVFLYEFGITGNGPGEFNEPQGIAVTPGDNIIVADTGNARIQSLTNTGTFSFEISAISETERARSSTLASDSLNITYSKEVFDGITVYIDYDLFSSNEEDKDTGEELVATFNNEINAQIRLSPYRWITFTSSYDLEFSDSETGDLKTERDEFIQTYALSLLLSPKVSTSATYTRSNIDSNVGADEDSEFTTVSLNLVPTDRITTGLSYSTQSDKQDGVDTTETDSVAVTTDMNLYRGVDLNLQFTDSHSDDFEADSTVDSQRVRGRLKLVPKRNMTVNATAEYNTSDSKFVDQDNQSSETILGSLDLAWAISKRLDLFLDLDYIESKLAGVTSNNVSYILNLTWAMNDKLTFFVGHRGGSEDEEVTSFRTQAKFPFVWNTRVSANFEIEQGQQSDRKYVFVEVTKIF